MARRPRMSLAGVPQHLVQRGNNRQPCFSDDADRQFYLDVLREQASPSGVRVHAYVLMSNHVHLLATPDAPHAVSDLMRRLGAAYVRRFNWRHARSGTLWEGRFHASLVDDGDYLWNCHRYIELNPVRAGMVSSPDAFRWSSHRANAWGTLDAVVTPHPAYERLGGTRRERAEAYGRLFVAPMSERDIEQVRSHLHHERALGDEAFRQRVESATGVPAAIRGPGRPLGYSPRKLTASDPI